MFQLRARLERLKESQGHNIAPETPSVLSNGAGPDMTLPSLSTNEEPEEQNDMLLEGEVECEEKSPEGNRRIKALLGRRQTHNEELCVASCGVLLGRATFFGSEAVNGVLVSLFELTLIAFHCS